MAVSLNNLAWSIGVYARRSLDDEGKKDLLNMRHACVKSCQWTLGRQGKEKGPYEFRLVDHGRQNELWTANALIECTPMKPFGGRRSWSRSSIARRGVCRDCCREGRSVLRQHHDASQERNCRTPGASPRLRYRRESSHGSTAGWVMEARRRAFAFSRRKTFFAPCRRG